MWAHSQALGQGECTSISDPGISGGVKDNLCQSSAVTGEEAPPGKAVSSLGWQTKRTRLQSKNLKETCLSLLLGASHLTSAQTGPSSLQEFSQRCPLVLSASLRSCSSLLSCSSPSPTIKPLLWAETRSNRTNRKLEESHAMSKQVQIPVPALLGRVTLSMSFYLSGALEWRE